MNKKIHKVRNEAHFKFSFINRNIISDKTFDC